MLPPQERDRQILRVRGLSDSDIEKIGYRSLERQWQPLGTDRHDLTFGIGKGGNLANPCPGILVPIADHLGLYIGLRIHNPEAKFNGLPKYLWLGKGCNHLPNGELPLALYGDRAGETVAMTGNQAGDRLSQVRLASNRF